MRLLWFILATAFASSLPSVQAPRPSTTNGRLISITNLAGGVSRHFNLVLTNAGTLPPNWRLWSTNAPGKLAGSGAETFPKPGVYKTMPYTCIVVVPPACPDDRSAVKPADPGPSIPMLQPDLRFIPRSPK